MKQMEKTELSQISRCLPATARPLLFKAHAHVSGAAYNQTITNQKFKQMKKLITFLLVLTLALAGNVSLMAQNFSGGDGSADSPYQIANLSDLQYLSENYQNNFWQYNLQYFIQTADIDASSTSTWNSIPGHCQDYGMYGNECTTESDCESEWGCNSTWIPGYSEGFKPIGSAFSTQFTSSYNGNGKTISNLYINRPNENYVGLFGRLKGATIENLTLINVDITGSEFVGAIAGYTGINTDPYPDDTTSINNCQITGTVRGWTNTGGLVGENVSSYINNSSSYCTIIATTVNGYALGGLVGINSSSATINNSHFEGTVQRSIDNPSIYLNYMGGLVGENLYSVVSNSYAIANIIGASGDIGSFAAFNTGTIINCYSTGTATQLSGSISEQHAGGFIGRNWGSITSCYSTSNAIGIDYIGGFVGVNTGTVSNCYSWGSATRSSGTTTNQGSFSGFNNNTIEFCYSTGDVIYTGSSDPTDKGFIGINTQSYNSPPPTTTHNYWDSEASNQNTAIGATAKTNALMKVQNTFTNWDFVGETSNGSNDYWEIDATEYNGYPYLSWQVAPTAPSNQATNISSSGIQATQMDISWTRGDGDSCAVFMFAGTSGNSAPVDNVYYAPDSVFQSGDQIGTSGWYCVYRGTGTSQTITGLTLSTDYRIHICEFNTGSSTGTSLYSNNTTTNNPANETSLRGPTLLFVNVNILGGNGDGKSWTNAYQYLQDALANSIPADTICVAAGTYYPDEGTNYADNARDSSFKIRTDVIVYGGFSGTETTLSERNWASNQTILSGEIDQVAGNTNNSCHVVKFYHASNQTIIDGFTITQGNASKYQNYTGGGIYNDGSGTGNSSNPQIRNCIINENNANQKGGAIYNEGISGNSSPTLINCIISGNKAQYGGGIYNYGYNNGNSSPTLINCIISCNYASYGGSAMYNSGYTGSSSPSVTNCIIYGNSTSSGHIYNNSATPSYSHCNIEGGVSGTNNINSDPVFMDMPDFNNAPTSDGDFHISISSPCIDVGLNSANTETFDLDAEARIQNTTIDIGAYEGGVISLPRIYVNANVSGGNGNGKTWTNAYQYLQDALANSAPGDTIWVATGTYYPDQGSGYTNDARNSSFNIPSDVVVYGGFDGTEIALAYRNWKANETILSGDIGTANNSSDNSYHIVKFQNASNQTGIDGFTITLGNANGSSPYNNGGGIYNDGSGSGNSSNPHIFNCIVSENSAINDGGALYNNGESGACSPDLTNCLVIGNKANNDGGAIYNNADNGNSSPNLTNCTFSGNMAIDNGGAFYNFAGSGTCSPGLTNCIVYGNSTTQIFNNSATPTYNYCNIEGGVAGGTGNIDSDPLFVDMPNYNNAPTSNGDLHITIGSLCIDAGLNSANTELYDLERDDRIWNSTIDIGAFETGVLSFTSGNGSQSNPYEIAVLNDLLFLSENSDYWASGIYFKQSANIDASTTNTWYYNSSGNAEGFSPVGNLNIKFQGNYNGGGHTIDGLFINRTSDYTSLFGYAMDGTIENIGVKNVNISGGAYTGGMVGMCMNSTFNNIYSTGTVSGQGFVGGLIGENYTVNVDTAHSSADVNGTFNVGGLVGQSTHYSDFSHCYSTGTVASTSYDVGGFCGSNNQSSIIQNSYSTSTVNSSGNRAGGFVGINEGTSIIEDCYSTGSVTRIGGTESTFGAFVGHCSSGRIEFCYTIGNVFQSVGVDWTEGGNNNGFISYNLGSRTNNFFDSEASNQSVGNGATAKTTVEMRSLETYTNTSTVGLSYPWNFVNESIFEYWDMDQMQTVNNGYPILSWQEGADNVLSPPPIHVNANVLGGNGCGTSWENATPNLQDALKNAVSGDTIYIAAGTYYPDQGIEQSDDDRTSSFQIPSGVIIYGGFDGTETSLSERDWETNPTILSGNIDQGADSTNNAYHVVTFENASEQTIIDGLTITGGNANGSDDNAKGGGIFNDASGTGNSSNPQITNCNINGNYATNGGAIACDGDNGGQSSPDVTNCVFFGNHANNHGGAIYCSTDTGESSPDISNCSFSANSSTQSGGAIFNTNTTGQCEPTINNCILWGNTANNNIGNEICNNNATPTVSHSIVKGGIDAAACNEACNDGGNNLYLDPQFFNATNGDLRLLVTSPAINVGLNSANTETYDLAGNARIQETTIDMGAYEGGVLPTVFYVNAAQANDSGDGSSWALAKKYLQSGLALAEYGNHIWVAAGTYYPDLGTGVSNDDQTVSFNLIEGVKLYGGFDGTESLLSARDLATNITILSGDIDGDDANTDNNFIAEATTDINGVNSYHIVYADGGDGQTNITAATELNGFIITAGYANGSVSKSYDGGGLYCNSNGTIPGVNTCNPSLINCTFSGNKAKYNGGAIFNNGDYGVCNPVLINCSFSGNSAESNGGAIYNNGMDGESSPVLTNCSFSGNNAKYGGAIYHQGTNSDGNPVLTNCILWGNTATENQGHEIYNSFAHPIISYSIVEGGIGETPCFRACTDGGNNLYTYPQFVDAANGDLHLYNISPAINAGDNTANTEDYDLDGNERIHNGIIDMGVYEGEGLPKPAIYVNANQANDNGNGSSWALAKKYLQSALAISGAGDTIWIAGGVYYPDQGTGTTADDRTEYFEIVEGVKLFGGFAGTETLLSQRDWETNLTILSGDIQQDDTNSDNNYIAETSSDIQGSNSYHVVTMDGTGTTNISDATQMDGIIITAGNASHQLDRNGGGLFCDGNGVGNVCNPFIKNCTFSGNKSLSDGGAMYNNGQGYGECSPVLTNCTFTGNSSPDNSGGAISNDGSNYGKSNPTLTSCSFDGNNSGQKGGAIYNYGVSNGECSPVLINCSFTRNSALDYGGAIYNIAQWSGNCSPQITNCILWGNTATSDGNEIYNASATPTVSYSIVQGGIDAAACNVACTDGGDNLTSDPQFVYAANGDLRLWQGSPAINAGLDSVNIQPYDLGGNIRIQNGTIDMGAYEGGVVPVVFYVNAAQADDNGDGSSWATAKKYLQSGLTLSEYGNHIWVAKGEYYPDEGTGATADDQSMTFNLIEGIKVFGGFAGTENSLHQRNLSANPSILSGDIGQDDLNSDGNHIAETSDSIQGNNSYHVVLIDGSGITNITEVTQLDGFYISAGNADGSTDFDRKGGALYCNGGGTGNSCNPGIKNCSFLGNFAKLDGGAIYNYGQDGISSPTITNCTFSGNSSTSGGGAIYNFGSSGISSPVLTNCSFLGNESKEGGAIWIKESSVTNIPVLINCSFSDNNATLHGGAICNYGKSSVFVNCILWGNVAGAGNQIFNRSVGITISYSIVQGGIGDSACNAACTDGGNNLYTDPKFMDAAKGNLRLFCGSPALNAGDNAANTETYDLAGNPRIENDTIDMGAYEGCTPEVAIQYVNTLQADDSGDGLTWATAKKYLQSALALAEEEVWVAKGVYYPDQGDGVVDGNIEESFFLQDSIKIYGGFAGSESLLGQRDIKNNPTILSGDIDQDDTNNDGNFIAETYEAIQGTNSYHIVFADASGATNISEETALNGFYVTGGHANGADEFANGGALYCDGSGAGNSCNPGITNCSFIGNAALSNGGSIYNSGYNGKSNPIITNCSFSGNYGNNDGGAIYNAGNLGICSPALINCSFTGNNATQHGGAILNNGSIGYCNPIITNCSFSVNSAISGGAIFNDGYNGESLPVLSNCILWGDTATSDGNEIFNNSATPVISYCNIEGSGTSGASWDTNLGTDNGNNIDDDPMFIDAVNGNLALYCGSPAIDAGDNAANTETYDLAGNPRIQNTTIDMGAFEGGMSWVYAGLNDTICYGITYNLTLAEACGINQYSWTTSGSGSFGNTSTLNTSYLPQSDTGIITLYLVGDTSYEDSIQLLVYKQFLPGEIDNTGETICYNGNPAEITSDSAAGGGHGLISYKWQKSSDSNFTSPADISSSNAVTYNPPTGLTETTWYRRMAKDNTCDTSFTASAEIYKVTVRDLFSPGAISGTNDTLCYNGDPAQIQSTNAASGGDEVFTYKWQESTTDSVTGFADISGATLATYNPPAGITAQTWYRRFAKESTCNTTFEVSAGIRVFVPEATALAGIYNKTPDSDSVCADQSVEAALTAGNGGNGKDMQQYRTYADSQWSSWSAYTSEESIEAAAVNTIQVRTWRAANYCDNSDTLTVSWTVIKTPVIYAGANQSICEGSSYTIQDATAVNHASLSWGTSGSGTFTNGTTLTPTYHVAQSDSAFVELTLYAVPNSPCLSQVSDTMVLYLSKEAIANAGTDNLEFCYTHTVSDASASYQGPLSWTTSGTGTLSNETTLTPSYAAATGETGNIKLYLHVNSNSPCTTIIDDSVTIVSIAPPTAEAGANDTLCKDGSLSISDATAANYTSISWNTSGTGTFGGGNTLTPTYNAGSGETGNITLTLYIDGKSPCAQVNDDKNIFIYGDPTADAGNDGTSCVTDEHPLVGQATNHTGVTWSILSGTGGSFADNTSLNTTLSGTAGTTYELMLTTTNGYCVDATDTMSVYFMPQAVADAGIDGTTCEGITFPLVGSATNYTSVTWMTSGDGTFDDPTKLDASYTPAFDDYPGVTLTLRAYDAIPCVITDYHDDSMELTVVKTPVIYAGADQSICEGSSYTIQDATAVNYASLSWGTSGSGSFTNGATLSPTYHVAQSDSALVELTLYAAPNSPCLSQVSDTMVLYLSMEAIANAGTDNLEFCYTHTVSDASASYQGPLSWTTSGTGTLSNETTLTPSYAAAAGETGNIKLYLHVSSNSPCTTIIDDSVTIVSIAPPTAEAGANDTLCKDGSLSISDATATHYTSISWNTSGTGTFGSGNTLTPTYFAGTGETGNITLTLYIDGNSPCAQVNDDKNIFIYGDPTADAGNDGTSCVTDEHPLVGQATNHTGVTWSILSGTGGSFADNTSLNTTLSGTAGTTYELMLTTTNGYCVDATDTMSVYFLPRAVADAGIDGTTCEGITFPLVGSATNYTSVTWMTSGDGTFDDPTKLDASYTPAFDDYPGVTLTLRAYDAIPCVITDYHDDSMELTVGDGPLVNAGEDQSICESGTSVSGTVDATSGTLWTTFGDGTFDTPSLLTAFYTPGTEDKTNGGVKLALVGNAIFPCTDLASDDIYLKIVQDLPTIFAGADATNCETDKYSFPDATAEDYGALLWIKLNADGTFDDPNTLHPDYEFGPGDIANGFAHLKLVASSVSPCTLLVEDEFFLSVKKAPIANAGIDKTLCEDGNCSLSDASALHSSTVLWTTSGSGTFLTSISKNPIYYPSQLDIDAGSIQLMLTANPNNPCSVADKDTMNLTFQLLPVADAGADNTICQNDSYTLSDASAENYSSVTWSGGSGEFSYPLKSDPDLNPSYTPAQSEYGTTVTLTLTAEPIGPCTTSDDDSMDLYIQELPTADAGDDDTVCEDGSFTVDDATAENYSSVTWVAYQCLLKSAPEGDGTFQNVNTLTPSYTPGTQDIADGVICLTLIAEPKSPCTLSDEDHMELTIQLKPIVDAGIDATICGNDTYTLSDATAENYSSVTWSGGAGEFSYDDKSNPLINATYTPDESEYGTTVTLTLTAQAIDPCTAGVDDTMDLNILEAPEANAGSGASICEDGSYTVDDATADNYDAVTWTSNGAGTIDDIATLTPTYNAGSGETGTITLILHAEPVSPCTTEDTDDMEIIIQAKPIADAGNDGTICADGSFTVSGSSVNNADSFQWSAAACEMKAPGGDGSWENETTLTPTYTPGTEDIHHGRVCLTLEALPETPCSVSAYSTIEIKINALPELTDVQLEISDAGASKAFLDYDFEEYNANDYLVQQAQTLGDTNWITWGNQPGTAQDAMVSNVQAYEGNNSLLIEGSTDCLLDFDPFTSGFHTVEFMIFIPTGKTGYFNSLQSFTNPSWGIQVFLNPGGSAIVDAGGTGAGSFSYAYDTWFKVKIDIDLDSDFAELFVANTSIINWDWSTGADGTSSLNEFSSINLYAATDYGTPGAFFDNIKIDAMPDIPVNPILGDLTNGYEICLNGQSETNYSLNVSDVTSSETLEGNIYNEFFHTATVPADFFTYWADRGVIDGATGWQGIMWDIINGDAPVFYLVRLDEKLAEYILIDGLQKQYASLDTNLVIPGDYPQGDYTFAGTIKDVNGCTSETQSMDMEFVHAPTAFAGIDASIASNQTYSLSDATATNYTSVTWGTSGDGEFDDDTELNPSYTPGSNDAGTNVTLTLYVDPLAPCADQVADAMTLTVKAAPVVVITSPADEEIVYAVDDVVGGTATDADGTITKVEVNINDGGWADATGTDTWSFAATYKHGLNTILARATDDDGYVSDYDTVRIYVHLHTIALKPGYQMISTYLNPKNPDIVGIMSPVVANLNEMITLPNKIYLPAFGINTILNWNVMTAYKLRMEQAGEITIAGDPLKDNTLNLDGFAYLPVLSDQASPIASIFADPMNDVVVIVELGNPFGVYFPDGELFLLETLEPGKGYQARFNKPVTVTYPEYLGFNHVDYVPQTIESESPWAITPTGDVHVISIQPDALTELTEMDYIGAFDSEGNCIGYADLSIGSGNLPMMVFGNDTYTVEKDGAAEGETIRFVAYSSATGEETPLIAEFDQNMPNHDGTFASNGLSIINNLYKEATGVGEGVAKASVKLFPNPAKGVVNILLPSHSMGSVVEISNAEGMVVKQIQLSTQSSAIDVSDLSSGVYFVRVQFASETIIKKLIIQ